MSCTITYFDSFFTHFFPKWENDKLTCIVRRNFDLLHFVSVQIVTNIIKRICRRKKLAFEIFADTLELLMIGKYSESELPLAIR